MKKKRLANIVMVLLIVVIAVTGLLTAFHLRGGEDNNLGSLYKITEIPDNALITPGQEGSVCTVTIVCDTILNNLDALDKEKAPYVPKDGVILPKTRVSFARGDSAFVVLQRVSTAADIQLESSWTPMYGSSYVEGINHLYEFDCGKESGWMYKVNGRFPNYGCSAYAVENGDDIVWCYTCNGYGKDVGSTWMAAEGGAE